MLCELDWALIVKLLPAIITALTGAAVTFTVFHLGRRQSRIDATLGLHKEYYASEFAEVRNGADRFIMYNFRQDWSKKPTSFDDPEGNRDSMHQLTRFFQRASVLQFNKQLNEKLFLSLFARDTGYWAGYLFRPMQGRTDWSTKEQVLALLDWLERSSEKQRFLNGFAEGDTRRRKGPVLVKTSSGELVKFDREVGEVFGPDIDSSGS